jgi:hypothetical protein
MSVNPRLVGGVEFDDILGQDLIAKVTVASVRAFLDKLLAVVNDGIADKKGLFALTD